MGNKNAGPEKKQSRFYDKPPPVPTRTAGDIQNRRVCVVSFPASESKHWEALIKSRRLNHACVWTGNENSPLEAWYYPWVDNVKKAHEYQCKFIVVAPSNQRFGFGQTKEINEVLESHDYDIVPADAFTKYFENATDTRKNRSLSGPGGNKMRAAKKSAGESGPALVEALLDGSMSVGKSIREAEGQGYQFTFN